MRIAGELKWQYCSLPVNSNDDPKDYLCEWGKEAKSVVDWLECPVCNDIMRFWLSFDFDKNYFDEQERIIKESQNLSCEHCGVKFIVDNGILCTKNFK